MKRKYASASLSINGRSEWKESRLEWFEQVTKELLTAPLASQQAEDSHLDNLCKEIDVAFSSARNSMRAAKCTLEQRLAVFSRVKCMVAEESSKDSEPDDVCATLLSYFAAFEASALDYPDSGDPLVDDRSFKESLPLLEDLEDTLSDPDLFQVSVQYFKSMDHLLAHDFSRRVHRRDGRVRIGPFTASDGINGARLLERASVTLDTEELGEFAKQAWQALHPHTPDLRADQVASVLKHLKPSPYVATFQA